MMTYSCKDVELIRVTPTAQFSVGLLQRLLPTIEEALFFAKVYELDYQVLSHLLQKLFPNEPVLQVLFEGNHSVELQDYLLDVFAEVPDLVAVTEDTFTGPTPAGVLLPHMWEQLEVDVATSIKEVATKLSATLNLMPSKEGSMVFRHLNQLNKQRPRSSFGKFGAKIVHNPVPDNLVIFDVSGSMTSETVRALVDDVVALSYKANAHLAIVSNNLFYWPMGTYSTKAVLDHAEYGGTCYDQLAPLFEKDWGTVITIADYDSYSDARSVIAKSPGRVGQVLDISLVDRPTFLAQCVGTIADEVRPLLVGNTYRVLSN